MPNRSTPTASSKAAQATVSNAAPVPTACHTSSKASRSRTAHSRTKSKAKSTRWGRQFNCTTSSQQRYAGPVTWGVDGALDTVLELPDRRTTPGMCTRLGLDNFSSILGATLRQVWHRSDDLLGRFVLALALIRHLPQQVFLGPGEIGDFHDQLGPHPMHL